MSAELAEAFASEKACPIFRVSNVSGEGLPLLKTFLNVVRPSNTDEFPVNAPFSFAVQEVYSVPCSFSSSHTFSFSLLLTLDDLPQSSARYSRV